MGSKITPTEKGKINVRDEKEFKLWIKFIASVYKSGGDINKPADILWKSFEGEIKMAETRCRIKNQSAIFS
jgi:hypothetical protein